MFCMAHSLARAAAVVQARRRRFREDVKTPRAALTFSSRSRHNQLTLPEKLAPLKALCEDRFA
jgi:hypothetical protein